MESSTGSAGVAGTTGATSNGRPTLPPPGTRTSEEIRRDIVAQRGELSRSVDALRTRWVAATDLGAQVRKHRTELLVGAAVVGFLVGGALALRRRG
ncbi:MAG: DUF3618 domain-containing protein [Actinobacteria bacterium]|nr:DUF3618 domain-containing protein [Actinomycetota bacterium]